MTDEQINLLHEVISENREIPADLALSVLNASSEQVPTLMAFANSIRVKNFGKEVILCSIVNAKSGSCSEDCAFCAQSAHHSTSVETYDMLQKDTLVDSFKKAADNPIKNFGVVTSGEGLDSNDIDTVVEAVKSHKDGDTAWCASLGILDDDELKRLKDAGLQRFHHNLETAESFFGNICTTHTYEERLDMVRRIKKHGMEICCGGLLGLGESLEQRVELATILKELDVDAIPLNFFIPVEGTKLSHLETMKPLDILKTIIMFRFVNPKAEIKVSAGRVHMRDLQSMIFYAGATGMMIGDLLTVAGRKVDEDLQMLEDLGIKFKMDEH